MYKQVTLIFCLYAPSIGAMGKSNRDAQECAATKYQEICLACHYENEAIARTWQEHVSDNYRGTHHIGTSARCTAQQAFDAVLAYHINQLEKWEKQLRENN
ncbi:MAG: hypothetical protein WCE21_02365 [Candidatus Babeliales bacterium]